MKTILNTDFAIAEFYEDDELIQVTWKKISGKLPLEEYKNTYLTVLNFHEQNKDKVRFFLSDIREQSVLSPDYRKWFQEEAMPRAINNGIIKSSVIFDGNVFQKYLINNIMNTTKKFGIAMKFFSKREDAIKWLHS
jgi:hypothetical protein